MVDLIPEDYRRSQRLRKWLRTFCWACAGVAVLIGVGRLGLAYLVRAEQARLEEARRVEAASGTQRARLAQLRARVDKAGQRLRALEILRGPAAIGELFYAVDAAMAGKVWFSEFGFAREGEIAEARPQAQQVGYFILIPKEKPAGAARGAAGTAGQAWRSKLRVQIRGQARDHSALAEFIQRFGGQPGIAEVRLVDTSARSYSNLKVVDFQLAAALGARPGAAR